MSFNLADVLAAPGRLVITLDRHPSGAVSLIVLTALLGMPVVVWMLRR